MNEIWKPVVGFEGTYEVSSLGKVRSLDRTRRGRSDKPCRIKGKILTLKENSNNHYLLARVGNKWVLVHRLVAQAFIPIPKKYEQLAKEVDGLGRTRLMINHKDENPHNNSVGNLEWCDCKYNNRYGTKRQRGAAKRSYVVLQYDLQGNLIKKYPSAREAARQINKSQAAISRCCVGRYNSAYGFVWKYDKS